MNGDSERRFTLSDFDYDLPEGQIAQHPTPKRDGSRLLILDRGQTIDAVFTDIVKWCQPGDLLIVNDTKVLPARLRGWRQGGREVEVLLLKRRDLSTWEALVRPGKKCAPGATLTFSQRLSAVVGEALGEGVRLITFRYSGVFEALLETLGETPLPPYIHERLQDPSRYQTVYAACPGSAAAPTAGLHFTTTLLDALEARGVARAAVTLDVGLGTFRPVRSDDLDRHVMHVERFSCPETTVAAIRETRARGGRIIAVGTTTARVLETMARRAPIDALEAMAGETDLFIRPGFSFALVDALVTNFHLPRSTLLMMVSAFYGYDRTMAAYRHAVSTGYRFFSFGDAMLLHPEGRA